MRLIIREQTEAERQEIEQKRREGELAKIPLLERPEVHSISYDGPENWWVELTYGYRIEDDQHVFGADDIEGVKRTLEQVTHCECESCIKHPRGASLD